MYEMSCQSRFDARYWMLGAGALGRPRGMEWGGRREEGSGWGSSVLAWRIPGTGEPGGLPSMGSHRVGHIVWNFGLRACLGCDHLPIPLSSVSLCSLLSV